MTLLSVHENGITSQRNFEWQKCIMQFELRPAAAFIAYTPNCFKWWSACL